MGVGIAVLHFVMIVPYVALQLSGLQILLRIAGYGAYDATASVVIGFIVLALFVFSAGLRGTAWASVVKDLFVLGAVIFAGIAIPVALLRLARRRCSIGWLQLHPQMLVLPPGERLSWNDVVCLNRALIGDRVFHGSTVVQCGL